MHVEDVLKSLGLAFTDPVLSFSKAISHGPLPVGEEGHTIVVGTPTAHDAAALAAVNAHARVGLIFPLGKGRAAASGQFREASAAALENAQTTVLLGDTIVLAPTFSVLEQAMWGINTVIAREAFSLARKSGVNLQLLYSALREGAAGSRAFTDLWPYLMDGDVAAVDAQMYKARGSLTAGLALASDQVFYAPLMASAAQAALVPLPLQGAVDPSPPPSSDLAPVEPAKVAFVGLGAMGRPMSMVLHKAGVNVVGYDVFPAARAAYAAEGGSVASSIHECTSGADVLILVVVSAAQISDILFAEGALAALGPEAAIIVMSTIAGADARSLGGRIAALRPDVNLLDCPASGSVARAAAGDLLVLVGGLDETSTSSHKAFHVLSLMSRSAGNNHLVLVGAVGQGSAAKLANQHLAGTQISCVAEMLALATKAGMNPRPAHTLLLSGPGWAWVLGHRGESMLQGLTTPPLAAVDILVKDMGIVVAEARALAVSVPLAALAQQQFVFAKSLGWGGDDDSGLVRVWKFAGIDVASH